MARTGARVTGGDLSEPMLAAARERAEANGLNIDFVHLDMANFTLDQRFDSIVIASNSLLHLTDTDLIVNALASARRHVAPHGQLVFDIFVPSAALLSLPPDQRNRLGAFAHPELGPMSLEETVKYDPISQVSEVMWYWSRPGMPDFAVHPLRMRQIYPQELPLLLARAGWRITERFGGFDGSALGPNSMRQVVICQVAA
jgi:SAM-dependent methyltransferase